jgi:hypothetical protein
MHISREEIFGPVLPVIPFNDFDEAIKIANDTPYGLASGVRIFTCSPFFLEGLSNRVMDGKTGRRRWIIIPR